VKTLVLLDEGLIQVMLATMDKRILVRPDALALFDEAVRQLEASLRMLEQARAAEPKGQ
jgi:hypothetical protein